MAWLPQRKKLLRRMTVARVHVQVLGHPVAVVVHEGPEGVEVLAAHHVDQEPPRLLQVGHGEADVVDAGSTRAVPMCHTPLARLGSKD